MFLVHAPIKQYKHPDYPAQDDHPQHLVPPYSISVSGLETFNMCPYLYRYQNHTMPADKEDQESFNLKYLKKQMIFERGHQREEIATNYLYGDALGDAALKNWLDSRQPLDPKAAEKMRRTAKLWKESVPKLYTDEQYLLVPQKHFVVFFADMSNVDTVTENGITREIPRGPIIRFSGVSDWIFNDHTVEDMKTSQGERNDWTIMNKMQYKVYPRFYALYKRGPSILYSNESYSFNYRILTKHVQPRLQTVTKTTTYAETTAELVEMITDLNRCLTDNLRPAKKSLYCKYSNCCPLYHSDGSLVGDDSMSSAEQEPDADSIEDGLPDF